MDDLVPMFWLCGALLTFCVVRAGPIVDGISPPSLAHCCCCCYTWHKTFDVLGDVQIRLSHHFSIALKNILRLLNPGLKEAIKFVIRLCLRVGGGHLMTPCSRVSSSAANFFQRQSNDTAKLSLSLSFFHTHIHAN
jgi:hypothetical protein